MKQYGISAVHGDCACSREVGESVLNCPEVFWRWEVWENDGSIRKGETATRADAERAVHA